MFARTQRLLLRPGWPEDAAALAAAIGHREVVDKLSRAPWPYTLDDAESFLAARGSIDANFLIFASPAVAPRLIGGISIDRSDAADPEFGYWLTPDAWGRGYATEAGRQVIEIARHALGISRLSSGHFIDNPASGRVLAKLGFRFTGRIEQRPSRARGGTAACALFELDLAEERRDQELLAA